MKILVYICFMCIGLAAFSTPSITDISVHQRYPWNGKVDLSFTINGETDVSYLVSAAAKESGTNVMMMALTDSNGSSIAMPKYLKPGVYKWVWNAGEDLPAGWVTDKMRIWFSIAGMQYSVRFNANGGQGEMINSTLTYGEVQSLPSNAFAKEGFFFAGWATNETGAVVFTEKQCVTNLTKIVGRVVDLYAVWSPATYMVIDLSSGTSALNYPISYLQDKPAGGWGDDYKTSKLVLRYITPGKFVMGSEQSTDSSQACRHTVSLTKGFWIGVFEMTQRQYYLVVGENPSKQQGDMRPVGQLCFGKVRGFTEGLGWPNNDNVDADSFMGLLRNKTQVNAFDLPTEAQWEYACRAGTTTSFNNGTALSAMTGADPNMDLLGRYHYNNGYYKDANADYKGGYSSHFTTVGSYLPNAWGLYDMHGNAEELVLDWYATYECPDVAIDPTGPSAPSSSLRYRSVRGGDAFCGAFSCRSASRSFSSEYYQSGTDYEETGFRLCCNKELK